MALYRWRGAGAGTQTAWNDGRNWRDASGNAYAQAVYPGVIYNQNDDVLFDSAIPGSGAAGLGGYDGITGGSGAAGTAVLTSQAVTSITITAGGTLYAGPPAITFTGGAGTGAAAHAVLTNGVVTSIVIDAGGSGYTSAPTVAFGSGPLQPLTSFKVTSLYNSTVGSAGNDVIIPVSDVILNASSVTATMYLNCNSGTAATVVVNGGTLQLDGTVKNLYGLKGNVTAGCSWASGAAVVLGYLTNVNSDFSLTIASSGHDPTTPIIVGGGTLDVSVAVDTIYQSAGTVNLRAGSDTRVIQVGGTFNWYGGSIGEVDIYGGTFNNLTVTPQTVSTLLLMTPGTANLDNGVDNLTVTAKTLLGGTYKPGIGSN